MPIVLTCSGCGQTYQLKDELAGQKVRCPGCASVHVVPRPDVEEGLFTLDTEGEGGDAGGLHRAFDRDRFLFRQKLAILSEKYEVWDDAGRPVLFIERPAHAGRQVVTVFATVAVFIVTFALAFSVILAQPGNQRTSPLVAVLFAILLVFCVVLTVVVYVVLTPKRHIYFYSDESKGELLLQVLQDQKLQLLVATYTVLDPEGRCLGRMRKNYLYNFIRKRWDVRDGEDGRLLLIAREDSLLLSLLRRVLGPMLGFLRTNFILVAPRGGDVESMRGEFNRKFTILDRYVLDLTHDRPRMIDRRLAVALGVLLDTGEYR
jgi:uncharacterized protein YxjI